MSKYFIMKKNSSRKLLGVLLFSILLFGCTQKENSKEDTLIVEEKVNYEKLPFRNSNGYITAVIEIPAGTNHKYEYNYDSKSFECEIIDNKPRIVKFMPYVANYGFIPGTFMNKERGGDGDALDVLVISETVAQGDIIEIEPIATLMLLDRGEEDHKIIAIPANNDLKLLKGDTLSIASKTIIKTWFSNYKGAGKMEFLSWRGKDSTLIEINKWIK
jgi:inorganic pyrophosphatase